MTTMQQRNESEFNEYKPAKIANSSVRLSWSNVTVSTKPTLLSWTKTKFEEIKQRDKNGLTNPNQPTVVEKTHSILNGVSGNINGGFWAIMGPSGSGKTTFLSTIALRLDTFRMNLSGDIRINGSPYTKHDLKCISGYVMQDDLVNPNLTVEETLIYTADLRMKPNISKEERMDKIDYVMKIMGIHHRKDVIVGDSRNKGISGGERKRLCIAMELLNDPSLLFLDEPTSGLDSETALSVCRSLHRLSNNKLSDKDLSCTVVCTIHQPQPQIFNLFNGLLLLRRGHIVYQGRPDKALLRFQRAGFPNTFSNDVLDAERSDAEKLLALMSLPCRENFAVDEEAGDEETAKQIQMRAKKDARNRNSRGGGVGGSIDKSSDGHTDVVVASNDAKKRSFSLGSLSDRLDNDGEIDNVVDYGEGFVGWLPYEDDYLFPIEVDVNADYNKDDNEVSTSLADLVAASSAAMALNHTTFLSVLTQWWAQHTVLLRRNLHLQWRRLDIVAINVLITLLLAFFISSSVWYNIGTGKSSASKRAPSLFFCVVDQGIVAAIQGTHAFPMERALMLRERAAGSYSVSAYFLAKSLADFVVQVWSPVVFTCIVYPSIGYAPTAQQFFIFMSFMILCTNATSSLMNMLSCVFVSIEMSTVLAACSWELLRLYGGFFISPEQMHSYPNWKFMQYIDYIKYTYVAVSLNEHSNLVVDCAPSELVNGKCSIPPLNTAHYTGDQLNEFYGFDNYTIAECAGYLLFYIFMARFVAYLALRFIKM